MNNINVPPAICFRSYSWLHGHSAQSDPAAFLNLVMSRVTADLVDRIGSAWAIGLTRTEALIDAVEAFTAQEASHLGLAWTDDPERWSDCLRQSALTLEYRDGARSLVAIGPKSSHGRYSNEDLQFARELCSQVGSVLRRVAASLETARREIESARNMQDRLSGTGVPEVDGIECSGACERNGGLGGDFYDLVSPAPGELSTMIGNVPVAGISGSILMTALKTLIRSGAHHRFDLADLVAEMNRSFWQTDSDSAVAPLFAARIIAGGRRLEYVNAGYQTAFIVRAGGPIDRLERNSPALGLNSRSDYRERTIRFQPGDILIAASDGVVEAARPEGNELGEAGLLQIIRNQAWVRTRDLPSRLLDAVEAFAGKGRVDRTVIAVSYRNEESVSIPEEMAAHRPLTRAVAA